MASQPATVSVSTGVVEPLVRKLESLLQAKSRKLKPDETKEVDSLNGELRTMSTFLRSPAAMEAPDAQLMEWMRQVREVTYDAEDCVDRFLRPPPAHQRKPSRSLISAALGRPASLPRTRSPSFADEIRQLTTRLKEANDRRDRYMVSVPALAPSHATGAAADPIDVTVDPQLVRMQRAAPVAIEGPTDEVITLLALEGDHFKVVSIVGMPGIGKTTLATNLYRRLQEGRFDLFDSRAFVYAGRKPSVRMVLLDIISQVSSHMQHKTEDKATDELDVVNTIRGLLENKRYLIVIDDILSISAWKTISCALPQNDGSRIIVTTRIHDVAKSCSSHPSDKIYMMKPLGDSDSERLLHRRIYGLEETCSEKCKQVHHDRVLKVCDGLPMAILVVASILTRIGQEPTREGEVVMNSTLVSALEQCAPLQGMRKMLHIIYTSLPVPLKSCFLYLSVFPPNYKVNKNRLIWRWIAEGFISGRGDDSAWGKGESYFNELVNRWLIQPVFTEDDDDEEEDGAVGYYKVHGAIHDFIVSLSCEENFVTPDEELESAPRDVIRRLSLNCARQEDQAPALDTAIMNLTQCRSFTFLGSAQWLPHLTNFQLLRVLDLEDAVGLKNENLDDIGRLFMLRYLGLGGEQVTKLPQGIGELQLLETLDMRKTRIGKLPSSAAGRMQKLVRLLAGVLVLDNFPAEPGEKEMQDMQMQELSMVSVNTDRSLEFEAMLAKMKHLRRLGLKWCLTGDDAMAGDASTKTLESTLIPSHNEVSQQSNICSCIPRSLSSCKRLTYLEITDIIFQSQEEDLHAISSLPTLTILKLSATGKTALIISQGFQSLKVFWFQRLGGGLGLIFQAGAMTQLRKLSLHFKALSQQQPQVEEQPSRFVPHGLQHLSSSLDQVKVNIDCDGATLKEVASVEDAIKKEVSAASKVTKLKLSRNNEQKMKRQDDGVQQSNASQGRTTLERFLSGEVEEINKAIGG